MNKPFRMGNEDQCVTCRYRTSEVDMVAPHVSGTVFDCRWDIAPPTTNHCGLYAPTWKQTIFDLLNKAKAGR